MTRAPSVMVLRVLALVTLGVAALAALLASAALAAPAPGAGSVSRRVRSVEASRTGLTAASGIAHSRQRERFFLLEPPAPNGSARRIVVMTAHDERVGSVEIPVASSHPLHLAFDDRHGRLLVYDTVDDRLVALNLQSDGSLDPAPARLETPRVGPLRVAGLAVDPGTGTVFMLDRLSRRILRFTPGATAADAAWIPLGALGRLDLHGLAYHQSHLYVLDREGRTLHELTLAGERVRSHDFRGAGVTDPQALLFAPSADRTDDPAAWHLFVAEAGQAQARPRSAVIEVALGPAPPLAVSAALATASLVRTIDTSVWPIPSPDPSGLTYDPNTGRLIIVDGEVEEMGIWRDVNFYELTLGGAYVRGVDVTGFSIEPVGVAFNTSNRHVIISDDDARAVFDIDPGADHLVGTADDHVTTMDTEVFDSGDPEGITYAPGLDRVFVADGANKEIYSIAPGPDGRFDGVGDVVTHFDISSFHSDVELEAVEYHPGRGTLFIVGSNNETLVELTTTGSLVNTWDITFLNADHLAGLAFAPGSSNPTATRLYISDRRVDNDSHSSENDGLIYEVALDAPPPPPPGQPGTQWRVAAGSDDAEENASGSVAVTGTDLELVEDGNLQVVGLRFANVTIPAGARVDSAFIQFKADEAHSGAASLVFQGQAADNAAAFTSATRNVSSRPRTGASATWAPPAWTTGAAGGSQRTANLASVVQEIVSRPGWASGNALALIVTGVGRRCAETFEGDAAGAPLLTVTLSTGPPVNRAPLVEAGPNRVVSYPSTVSLDGTVSDDALPAPPALTTRWTKGSGPAGGNVTFANDQAVDTQANFSAAGLYVLRLTATDGALSTTDSVTIDLRVPGSEPVILERRIAAGGDDAEENATSGSMDVGGGDLELVEDAAGQVVGLRFSNLAIPPGARVDSAFIQFQADEAHSGATSLVFQGQAADNAAAFTSATRSVSSRPRTVASATWAPPAWTTGAAGASQRTTNLATIVQEIVSRPGWASGNALAMIVTGTGRRTAETFEGLAAGAPLLRVTLGVGPPVNRAPLVEAGPNQLVNYPSTVALDGTVTDDGLPAPPALTTRWTKGSGPAGGNVTFTNDQAVDTQASFTAAGTYVLRLTATDGPLTTTDSVTIELRVPGTTPVTVERRVIASGDDAEEKSSGSMSLDSGDLEMVLDGSNVQKIGVRFTGLSIPKGARITSAWIQFTTERATTAATTLQIRAQAADNAATFTTTSGNIGTRPLTTNSVSWSPAAWPTAGQALTAQRTPDLKTVIEELTARAGWTPASPIVIVITGTGLRSAESFDGAAAGAALLHVEYTN